MLSQSARLHLLGRWMRRELETLDPYDEDTLKALRGIVEPIANLLNIEVAERDPGPIELTTFNDVSNGAWWGHCENCGIVSAAQMEREEAEQSLGRHMAYSHPFRTFELKESQASS